jgi:hypothetical protein
MSELDPTYDLVRSRKVPMTPEQLDALRPKPVARTNSAPTAARAAYDCGIKGLEPILLRLEAVEKELAELKSKN